MAAEFLGCAHLGRVRIRGAQVVQTVQIFQIFLILGLPAAFAGRVWEVCNWSGGRAAADFLLVNTRIFWLPPFSGGG